MIAMTLPIGFRQTARPALMVQRISAVTSAHKVELSLYSMRTVLMLSPLRLLVVPAHPTSPYPELPLLQPDLTQERSKARTICGRPLLST